MSARAQDALLTRGAVYGVALAAQLGSSLLTLPIVLSIMEPSDYGAAVVGATLVGLLSPVAGLGVPSAVMRVVFDGATGSQRGARTVVSGTLTAAAIVLAATAAVAVAWHLTSHSFELLLAAPIGVATVAAVAHLGCASLLQAGGRAGEYVVTVVTVGVASQFGAILLMVLFAPTPLWYLAGFASGNVMGAVYAALRTGAYRHGLADAADFRQTLRYSTPYVSHGVAWLGLAMGDRVVIGAYEGTASVAIYHVAYTVGSLGMVAMHALGNAWVPLVFGAQDAERETVQHETAMVMHAIGAATAVALAFAGPAAIELVAPATYANAALPGIVALTSATTLTWIVYARASQVLLWHKATAPLGWITPLSVLLNLGLVVLLLPPLGLIGAGIATLVAYSFLAAAVHWRAARFQVERHSHRAVILIWVGAGILLVVGAVLPSGSGLAPARVAVAIGAMATAAFWAWRQRKPVEAALAQGQLPG